MSSTAICQNPPFDFYVVLDFEAAFDKPSGHDKVMEIIELPSVVVDARTGEVRSEFQRYARPVIHPKMHPEVTTLTGITQQTVDAAQPFPIVFQEYRQWLLASGLSAIPPTPSKQPAVVAQGLGANASRAERKQAAVEAAAPPTRPFIPHARSRSFCFVTCGDWDIKTMLPVQFKNEGGLRKLLESEPIGLTELVPYVEGMAAQWVNLKDTFNACVPGLRQPVRGMTDMLKELQLPLIGRHHSGIDDCRNIAAVLQQLLRRGIRVDATNTRANVDARRGGMAASERNDLIRRGNTAGMAGRLPEFHGDLSLPFAAPTLSDRNTIVPNAPAASAATVSANPQAAAAAAPDDAASDDDGASRANAPPAPPKGPVGSLPVAAASKPKRRNKARLQ